MGKAFVNTSDDMVCRLATFDNLQNNVKVNLPSNLRTMNQKPYIRDQSVRKSDKMVIIDGKYILSKIFK